MTDDTEHLSQHGANVLARRLRAYWLDRGFNISTTVECMQTRGRQDIYGVRSNLVGGRPPAGTRVDAMDEAA